MPLIGQKNRIIINVFFKWAAYFISLIISFFMMPFVIRHLGDVYYGIWILIGSVTGYLGLLDLGISASVQKYISQFHAKEEDEKLNEFASTSFFSYLAIGVIVFFVSCVIALFFNRFFKIDPTHLMEARLGVIIVGLSIATSFPLGVFGGILRGIQRFDITSIVEIVALIIRTILVVAFLSFGFGIIALALISLFISLAASFWRAFHAFSLLPKLKIKFSFLKKKTMILMRNYSAYSFIASIGQYLIYYTDTVVIGIFVGPLAITYYSIAGRLVEYLRQIINELVATLLPAVSEFDAKNDLGNIHKLYILGSKYSLFISLPIITTFIVMGKPFISFWVGNNYATNALPVLTILMFGQLIAISQYMSGTVLFGMAKHKIVAIITICEAVANLILSVALVKRLGIIGVAVGTTIPIFITHTFIYPTYTCKKINLAFSSYFKKALLPPTLSVIPFIFLILFFRIHFSPTSWKILFQQAAWSYALFLFTSWFLFFTPDEKNYVLKRKKRCIRFNGINFIKLNNKSSVKISVIICTRNRAQSLKDTLESLLLQKTDENLRYEIIIVDNDSRDSTKDLVESYKPRFGGRLRYFFEKTQGASSARNKGIIDAQGEIIAFSDDDVIMHEKWLMNIAQCFEKYQCDGLGGRILPIYPPNTKQWVKDYKQILCGPVVCHDYGTQTKPHDETAMNPFVGASMAFKKNCFEIFGLFRADLGPGTGSMGEDTEFFKRVFRGKKKLIYCGDALVWHKTNPKRINFKYFAKYYFAMGRYFMKTGYEEEIEKKNIKHIAGFPGYLIKSIAQRIFILPSGVLNRGKFLKIFLYLFVSFGELYEYRVIKETKTEGTKEAFSTNETL